MSGFRVKPRFKMNLVVVRKAASESGENRVWKSEISMHRTTA